MLSSSATTNFSSRMRSNQFMNINSHLTALLASGPPHHQQMRNKSTASVESGGGKLTHVDADGKARMVDVNDKQSTVRIAVAKGKVYVGPTIAKLIEKNTVKKGDVLSVAQIAGIIAAKRTSEIIPLCHNIPISSVVVNTDLNKKDHCVHILATVKCEGKTGVEMEALCAVSTAALTVYDMCKALSKDITISDIQLMKKTGGKETFLRDGFIDEQDNDDVPLRKYNTEPISAQEPFYPTHIWIEDIMHLGISWMNWT